MPTPDAIISGIRDELLRYYDTAYRLADRGLMAERAALLRRQGIVFGEPFIELLPQYPLAGDHDGTVRTPAGSLELAGAPPILAELIEEVMLDGVPRPRRLFAHQEEALAASFGRERARRAHLRNGLGKDRSLPAPHPEPPHCRGPGVGRRTPRTRRVAGGGLTGRGASLSETPPATAPQRCGPSSCSP